MKIGVREADLSKRDERSFVADAFVRSICSSRRYDSVSNGVAMNRWRRIFDWLAETATVVIAVRDDDPTKFVGFAIYDAEARVIHYIYIKYAYRTRGYGSNLLRFCKNAIKAGSPAVFTVFTSAMAHLAEKWDAVVDEEKLLEPYYMPNCKSEGGA